MHIGLARRSAALTAGNERGVEQLFCGQLEVGVFANERRILPAHLEADQFGRGLVCRRQDHSTDARRAGEQDAVDARVGRELLAGACVALDHVEDPRREFGCGYGFAVERRHTCSLLAGLEDHRVSEEEGG